MGLFKIKTGLFYTSKYYKDYKDIWGSEKYSELIGIYNSKSDDFDELFFKGLAYVLEGRLHDAIKLLEKVIQLNPKSMEACYYLGKCYLYISKKEKMREIYEKAITLYSIEKLGEMIIYADILYELKFYSDAIYVLEKLLIRKRTHVYAYVIYSKVLEKQKKHNESQVFYERIIEKFKKPKFSYDYFCMGNAYSAMNFLDKSNDCLLKAQSANPHLINVSNNLAINYFSQGKLQDSISELKRELILNDKNSDVLVNMGIGYSALGQSKNATKYFLEALNIDRKSIFALHSIGVFYRDSELEYIQAIKYFNLALDTIETREKDNESLKLLIIEDIVETEKRRKLSVVKNVVTDDYEPMTEASQQVIDDELKRINDKAKTRKVGLNDFLDELHKKNSYDYLEILKRWNSFTPILKNNNASLGGGYFLSIDGKGIVIDPGHDFINNFHKNEFSSHKFGEIDYIFITHAHDDHTYDLESLLTLLYKYNNIIKYGDTTSPSGKFLHDKSRKSSIGNSVRYKLLSTSSEFKSVINGIGTDEVIKKYNDGKLDHILDKIKSEITKDFLMSNRRKVIKIFVSKSVYHKYSGLLSLRNNEVDYTISILDVDDNIKLAVSENKFIDVNVTFAKHDDVISNYSAVGLIFNIDNVQLLYTGDTGYSDSTITSYKKYIDNDKKLILLAHIGALFEYNDLLKIDVKNYNQHLGFDGTIKLIERIKPNYVLLSEIGEEFETERDTIANLINVSVKNTGSKVIPADIGLRIKIGKTSDISNIQAIKVKGINRIDNQQPFETSYFTINDLGFKEVQNKGLRYFNARLMTEKDLE